MFVTRAGPRRLGATGSVGLGTGGRCSAGGAQGGSGAKTTHLFLQMSKSRSTTRPVMSVRQIQTMVRVS